MGWSAGGVAGAAFVNTGLVFALRATQCLKLGFFGILRAERLQEALCLPENCPSKRSCGTQAPASL